MGDYALEDLIICSTNGGILLVCNLGNEEIKLSKDQTAMCEVSQKLSNFVVAVNRLRPKKNESSFDQENKSAQYLSIGQNNIILFLGLEKPRPLLFIGTTVPLGQEKKVLNVSTPVTDEPFLPVDQLRKKFRDFVLHVAKNEFEEIEVLNAAIAKAETYVRDLATNYDVTNASSESTTIRKPKTVPELIHYEEKIELIWQKIGMQNMPTEISTPSEVLINAGSKDPVPPFTVQPPSEARNSSTSFKRTKLNEEFYQPDNSKEKDNAFTSISAAGPGRSAAVLLKKKA
eukprot:g2670.t1